MEPTNIEDYIDEHTNAPIWIDFSTLEDSVDKNDENLFFCKPVYGNPVLWQCGDDIGGDVLGMWRRGACNYYKTKHSHGHLGSYTIESIVERIRNVVANGVKEIWISSEDTRAYGSDIGVNLPILLKAIIAELRYDRITMF
ncbi:hypothetical protein GIB67_004916 [Kingdonia uniflora]|uniref:Uncharacterized protein n=1 Tax=Kingdonia uniflora TaxID=39325 RepID=A0A7J7LNL5_9MAGN|nr:hypothetical protein GIB67_004916 [Kingdonia uniflora]